MRSSTSSSEHPRSFAWRALGLALLMLAIPTFGGRLVGKRFEQKPLRAEPREIERSDHFVLLFGNSRLAAAVDPERLATTLGHGTESRSFVGAGWDALHYHQLAISNEPLLRAGRDSVFIEVSPFSLDDANERNRLAAIRPETATRIASLPGMSVEERGEILFGAFCGLYRRRFFIQSTTMAPSLDRAAQAFGDKALRPLGLLGEPGPGPHWQLVMAKDRDLVVEEVRGDGDALRAWYRPQLEEQVRAFRFGGYKLEALRRSAASLRAHGVRVFLLQVPYSSWLTARLYSSPEGEKYVRALRELAETQHAEYLENFGAEWADERRYFDDEHLTANWTAAFTDRLASTSSVRALAD